MAGVRAMRVSVMLDAECRRRCDGSVVAGCCDQPDPAVLKHQPVVHFDDLHTGVPVQIVVVRQSVPDVVGEHREDAIDVCRGPRRADDWQWVLSG